MKNLLKYLVRFRFLVRPECCQPHRWRRNVCISCHEPSYFNSTKRPCTLYWYHQYQADGDFL